MEDSSTPGGQRDTVVVGVDGSDDRASHPLRGRGALHAAADPLLHVVPETVPMASMMRSTDPRRWRPSAGGSSGTRKR